MALEGITRCIGGMCPFLGIGNNSKSMNPLVALDNNTKGHAVNLSNFFISGTGVAFANVPLLQTRAYFEVTVEQPGAFAVGVAHHSTHDLHAHVTDRSESFGYYGAPQAHPRGDVIGVAYDLSGVKPKLEFYTNGKQMKKKTIRGIRGEVWPCVSVSDGCMLEVNFGDHPFKKGPPDKFEGVIYSRDIL